MTEFLHTIGPIVNWLIASGVLAGAWRALRSAIKKRRAGVSVHDGKRRIDLLGQRDAAIGYAHLLREDLLVLGIHPTGLRPWPDLLKDSV